MIQKTEDMEREATFKNSFLGQRAVVVGAGLGGLSAARVLADYFDEVIILDRDELPDDAAPRPGVPQGKHPHVLLGGGLKVLENLFPGFGHGEPELNRWTRGSTASLRSLARMFGRELNSAGRPTRCLGH